MSHEYFVAKARAVFAEAGGNPDLSGQLAAWAEAAHGGDSRRGVIVAETGEILAETKHTPSTPSSPGAAYITSVTHEVDSFARNGEVGIRLGVFKRNHGVEVIHVKYWQVCQGASRFIPQV
jgi:hypothetical protein